MTLEDCYYFLGIEKESRYEKLEKATVAAFLSVYYVLIVMGAFVKFCELYETNGLGVAIARVCMSIIGVVLFLKFIILFYKWISAALIKAILCVGGCICYCARQIVLTVMIYCIPTKSSETNEIEYREDNTPVASKETPNAIPQGFSELVNDKKCTNKEELFVEAFMSKDDEAFEALDFAIRYRALHSLKFIPKNISRYYYALENLIPVKINRFYELCNEVANAYGNVKKDEGSEKEYQIVKQYKDLKKSLKKYQIKD